MKNKKILILFIFFLIVLCLFFLEKNLRLAKKNHLKIGIISDVHHCSNQILNSKPFTEAVDKANVNFNVSLGDNINFRVGNCSKSYQEDLVRVVNDLKTASPLHFVLGDHDIGDDPTVAFWQEKTKKEKEYYSFDQGNFHIIIMDTVLGGEKMRLPCAEDPVCSQKENEYLELKNLKKNEAGRKEYLLSKNWDELKFKEELQEKETAFDQEYDAVQNTRSAGRRDIGRVAESQLEWLQKDLADTLQEKIIIFSDHPLFHFISPRKEYNIANGDKVREILKKSGKQVVCISGEAHLWHEENIDGIQYYIINRYAEPDRSFAIFEWNKKSYNLNKLNY